MQNELHNARQQAAENERLKGLARTSMNRLRYQTVPARVIARDPSVWFNTITINRGSSSGVAVNMPVVTGNRNCWSRDYRQSMGVAGDADHR